MSKDLREAIAEHYAAPATDRPPPRLTEVPGGAPPRPVTLAEAVADKYADDAALRSFTWDGTRELLLAERLTAGATFTPEIEAALDAYANARTVVADRGLIDVARRRAQGGKR